MKFPPLIWIIELTIAVVAVACTPRFGSVPPLLPVFLAHVLCTTAEIEIHDVVDYAQRISGITSAPSYWKPGMAMVGFAPPAPRPEMMRAGALSAFAASAPGGFVQAFRVI